MHRKVKLGGKGSETLPDAAHSRAYLSRCSVGTRPSESAEGKEAEAVNSMERVGDAGRRSHSVLTAGRSQDWPAEIGSKSAATCRRPLPGVA
jgi:hypothetical protein